MVDDGPLVGLGIAIFVEISSVLLVDLVSEECQSHNKNSMDAHSV